MMPTMPPWRADFMADVGQKIALGGAGLTPA